MREKIYEKIFENLEDLLAEEQAKLGYRKEPVRFYYPLSSLNHFFDASFSEEEMKEALKEFPAFAEERFGNVEITGKGERFCFFLSEKATEYVHGHQGANAFIFELVETLSVHGTTMAEVEEVFKKQPFSYERKKVDTDEFDCCFYFTEGKDSTCIVSRMKVVISFTTVFCRKISRIWGCKGAIGYLSMGIFPV